MGEVARVSTPMLVSDIEVTWREFLLARLDAGEDCHHLVALGATEPVGKAPRVAFLRTAPNENPATASPIGRAARCDRPAVARSRAPLRPRALPFHTPPSAARRAVRARWRSPRSRQTMTLTQPVSSSSVTNTTPEVVSGRCRPMTMPAARTLLPVRQAADFSAAASRMRARRGRSSASGCRPRVSPRLA